MTRKVRDDELTADDRHSRVDQQHEMPPRPSRPPPPVAVAQPWQGDKEVEPTTNPGLKLTAEQLAELRALDPASATVAATPAYVKVKTEDAKREFRWADVKWFFATLATIGTFLFAAAGWAGDQLKAKIDAGTDDQRRDIVELKKNDAKQDAALAELLRTQQQQALDRVRDTTMLENLSRRLGTEVPPPAPKVDLSKDGGS